MRSPSHSLCFSLSPSSSHSHPHTHTCVIGERSLFLSRHSISAAQVLEPTKLRRLLCVQACAQRESGVCVPFTLVAVVSVKQAPRNFEREVSCTKFVDCEKRLTSSEREVSCTEDSVFHLYGKCPGFWIGRFYERGKCPASVESEVYLHRSRIG